MGLAAKDVRQKRAGVLESRYLTNPSNSIGNGPPSMGNSVLREASAPTVNGRAVSATRPMLMPERASFNARDGQHSAAQIAATRRLPGLADGAV
jgi:hypothetical protein